MFLSSLGSAEAWPGLGSTSKNPVVSAWNKFSRLLEHPTELGVGMRQCLWLVARESEQVLPSSSLM